jgi:tetratricopeptide (TPR) repeat protein
MILAVKRVRAAIAFMVTIALAAGCSSSRSALTQKPAARTPQGQEVPDTVKLTEQKPEKPTPQMLVDFANFHSSAKKYELAAQLYRKALADDPAFRPAFVGLARMHHDRGEFAEMLNVARAGLAKHPDAAELWNEVAVAHARSGDLRAADAAIRKALAKDPDNKLYLLNHAGILASAGDSAQSFTVYRRVLPPAEAHYRLAGTLYHQGRVEEAVNRLRQALGEDATHVAAAAMLQRLRGEIVPASYSVGESEEHTLRLNESIPTESSPSSQRVATEPAPLPTNGGYYNNGSRIGRNIQREIPTNR